MVVHYQYKIKFPFGAVFNKCPKYLIYSGLMNKIKKLTCIDTNQICYRCLFQNQCIYHHISGEDFSCYPAILIEKKTMEKKCYAKDDIFILNFYLFSNLLPYEGYLRGYIEESNQFYNQFYQIFSYQKTVLQAGYNYSGDIKLITPCQEIENLSSQIEYYNSKYKCKLLIPKQIIFSNEKIIFDETRYFINNNRFFLGGKIGTIKIVEMDSIFIMIGFGKTNFLGGGMGYASQNQNEDERVFNPNTL